MTIKCKIHPETWGVFNFNMHNGKKFYEAVHNRQNTTEQCSNFFL